MFEISILKDEFLINQDDKKTSIPISNLVSLYLFKNKHGEFYEIECVFISEERLDGFDHCLKKYNGKTIHFFSGILDKYPFKNRNLSEFNPFADVQISTFISLHQEYKPNNSAQYVNLDYVTSFNIFLDKRKMKEDKLFEVTLDGNFNVVKTQTQSLKPMTYVVLLLMNDESVSTSTQSFINALKNINPQLSSQQSKTKYWIDEALDFLQQQLVFAN